jgi:iron complex outermembrane receptor protein
MKPNLGLFRPAALCSPALLLIPLLTFGQTSDIQPTTSTGNDTVTLEPFMVKSTTKDDAYLTTQTLSGGRVRTDVADLPASINIVNRNLIDDVMAFRVIDAAMLVSGVGEGTIPNVIDRTMIRGISTDQRLVDGFVVFDQANTESANIDRLEVVKGPSALLFATAPAGGLINQITKSPVAQPLANVTAEMDSFGSMRTELDLGGAIDGDKKLLYRLPVAYQTGDTFWDGEKLTDVIFAPSLSYRLSSSTQLLLKTEYYTTKLDNFYVGIPWDRATNAPAAVPASQNIDKSSADNLAVEYKRLSGLAQLTTVFNSHFSMRLAARAYTSTDDENDLTPTGALFDSRISTLTPLQRLRYHYDFRRWSVQNDFLATFDTGPIAHSITVGWEDGQAKTITRSLASAPVNQDVFHPIDIPLQPFITPGGSDANQTLGKGFVLEQATLFDGKLLLSGGLIYSWFDNDALNVINGAYTRVTGSQTNKQYGIVIRPVKNTSVYYSYTENFVPGQFQIGIPAQGIPQSQLPNTVSKQNEVGVKFSFLNDRLTFSSAYYDILAAGALQFSVVNGLAVLNAVNTISRGIEFDLNANLGNGVAAIVGYSDGDSKSSTGIQSRGAADQLFSSWVTKRFEKGTLAGFMMGGGVRYSSDRPGDFNDSFRVPAYTLVNAVLGYDFSKVKLRLNIDNVFDEYYISAPLNQGRIYAGPGRDIKFSVGYSF